MLTPGTDSTGVDTVTDGNTAFDVVKLLRTELSLRGECTVSNRTLLVNPEFSEFLLGTDSKPTNVNESGTPQGMREATIRRLLGFRAAETSLISPPGPAPSRTTRPASATSTT